MTHGTINAYKNKGCRCEPCTLTYSAYNKRRDYLAKTGRSLRVPSLGTHRRIRALQRLGYGLPYLADTLGIATGNLSYKLHQPYVARTTHNAVADLYNRLSMLPPPSGWIAERTRTIGAKRGWPSPLCWDDNEIDDPAAQPRGQRHPRASYDSAEIVDEATVLRILAGEVLPANRAERVEVMRRWLARGGSERSLCIRQGWKDGRYVTRSEEVA